MGILDDAIREHLDLKRRQGADQDELQRLEDEAFGPPTRPGDPEFAERQADAPEGGQLEDGPEDLADSPGLALEDDAFDESELELGTVALPGEPTVIHDTLGEAES